MEKHNLKKYNYSAEFIFTKCQKIFLYLLIITTILLHIIYKEFFIILFINIVNFFHLFFITIKISLVAGGNILYKRNIIYLYENFENKEKYKFKGELPIYSILLPIYKEAAILEHLINNISKIKYPKNKLQVLLLVESDDTEILEKLKTLMPKLPCYFQVINVCDFYPKTKAKACNYGLQYVRGEFVTIYDAEDKPHIYQLLIALNAFKKYDMESDILKKEKNSKDRELVCVQSRLKYYNAKENWLTKMFEIEYDILFNYMLPTIVHNNYPAPLGGTSNHFRTNILKAIGGWDPYNVTEDAELGMRFASCNMKVAMINSYTDEESPITLKAWMKQRVRWMKGHIHTYIAYLRYPIHILKIFKIKGFIMFHYMLGLNYIFMMLSPFAFMVFILNIFGISLSGYAIKQYCYLYTFTTIVSTVNFIVYFISTLLYARMSLKNKENMENMKNIQNKKYKQNNKQANKPFNRPINRQVNKKSLHNLIHNYIQILTFPIYSLLHVVAAFLALYELIVRPHHWDKTTHGLSKIYKFEKFHNKYK